MSANVPPGSPFYGTEVAGGCSAETMEERLGRCYELATWALLMQSDRHEVDEQLPKGTVLVHGSIHGPLFDMQRIGHAWLELPDNWVWEPVSRKIWNADAWTNFARPIVERRYSRLQTFDQVIRSGHSGPWH
jgi:hypothetical protein